MGGIETFDLGDDDDVEYILYKLAGDTSSTCVKPLSEFNKDYVLQCQFLPKAAIVQQTSIIAESSGCSATSVAEARKPIGGRTRAWPWRRRTHSGFSTTAHRGRFALGEALSSALGASPFP